MIRESVRLILYLFLSTTISAFMIWLHDMPWPIRYVPVDIIQDDGFRHVVCPPNNILDGGHLCAGDRIILPDGSIQFEL